MDLTKTTRRSLELESGMPVPARPLFFELSFDLLTKVCPIHFRSNDRIKYKKCTVALRRLGVERALDFKMFKDQARAGPGVGWCFL